MGSASLPAHPGGSERLEPAGPYLRVAASYTQRRSLWAPAAAFGVYLAVIAFGPAWSGEAGPGLGRATQALLANVGAVIYLITASLALGSHLREQLTSPRGPLMPGFARLHRVVAGTWLAGGILLPALIIWGMSAPALATEGSSWPISLLPILAGSVAIGLWTGYLLPWGLLLPPGAFIVYQALATMLPPEALLAVGLLGCAAAVAMLGMQRPRDGSSTSNAAQLTVNHDRIEVLSGLSSGLLPRLLVRFEDSRFQAPSAWIGHSFVARVLHRKRSLPVLRWETLVMAALPVGWVMLAIAANDNLRLELAAASLRTAAAGGSDVLLSGSPTLPLEIGLAVIVVTLWRELSTWIAAGQARRQLGYESVRSGTRQQYLLEVGVAWYLHGSRALCVAVVLPSIGTLLYVGFTSRAYSGQAGQALEMAGCLLCADLLVFAASLYERLLSWKDGLLKGLIFSTVYVCVFLGSGALLLLWPELTFFLAVSWLAIAAVALAALYRWGCRADLE